MANLASQFTRWLAPAKKPRLFFTLKTLKVNGVNFENQPSRPAYNHARFVSSIGSDNGFVQYLKGVGRQIRGPAKVRLVKWWRR